MTASLPPAADLALAVLRTRYSERASLAVAPPFVRARPPGRWQYVGGTWIRTPPRAALRAA